MSLCVQYYGEGVLHLAVWGGNGAVAPLLPYCIKKGISVDARSILQRTPLHHAAMHGNNTMIDALLGQGAGEQTPHRPHRPVFNRTWVRLYHHNTNPTSSCRRVHANRMFPLS